MLKKLAAAIFVALFASAALAQAPVQQSPTRLDAAVGVAYATGAINTANTATIVVPGGQYAYIVAIGLDACENATGTGVPLGTFTSTNINSSPTWLYSVTGADVCYRFFEAFPSPLKSAAAGTNVTVVGGAQTTVATAIRVYYYLAP